MVVTQVDGPGPGRDPYEPLIDELTLELMSTGAEACLEHFDPDRSFYHPLDESDSELAVFHSDCREHGSSREQVISDWIARIQESLENGPQFKDLSKDIEFPKGYFHDYFMTLESCPFFFKRLGDEGISDLFPVLNVFVANEYMKQILKQDHGKTHTLLFTYALKLYDIQRQLLLLDQEVSEVSECVKFIKISFSTLMEKIDQMQSSGDLTPSVYRRLVDNINDIPIWNTDYGAACGILIHSDTTREEVLSLLSGLSRLIGVTDKIEENDPALLAAELDKELQYGLFVQQLALKPAWTDPVGQLTKVIQQAQFVSLRMEISKKNKDRQLEFLKLLSTDSKDLLILDCRELAENILAHKRKQRTVWSHDQAYKAIRGYLADLAKNKGLAPFYIRMGLPLTNTFLDKHIDQFDAVTDFLRSNDREVLVLPFIREDELEPSSGEETLVIPADRRALFIRELHQVRYPFSYEGEASQIAQVCIKSISKDARDFKLGSAILSVARGRDMIGIHNNDLLDLPDDEHNSVRHLPGTIGDFGAYIQLTSGETAETPVSGADYYIFLPENPDDNDRNNILNQPAGTPDTVLSE